MDDPTAAAEKEASRLIPGDDGQPLPPGEWVIRLSSPSKDGKPNVAAFNLSGSDKTAAIVRLSVYAEKLTTYEQAWRLTGAKSKNSVILKLNVDKIRNVPSADNAPTAPFLDVEWEQAYTSDENGKRYKDKRLGSEGHCGIRHMNGTTSQRARVRIELTKIATEYSLPADLLATASDSL